MVIYSTVFFYTEGDADVEGQEAWIEKKKGRYP